jgi:hypothetical protein
VSSAGRHRLMRRGLLSALAGLQVCVVVAAPVFAFASRRIHVTIVPVPVQFPNETFGSSTATCPTGQHVLFGGFKNAFSMRRTANNRWTAYGSNSAAPPFGSAPIRLSSYVYCGYGPVPSKATSTVEIRVRPGGGPGSATARCPAGTVVAGGFATAPHTSVDVTGLERVASDLWRVSAFLSVDTHTALTSIAYCGPGPAPKLVSQTVNTGGVTSAVRATCPVGRHLVFGGAILTGVEDTLLQTLRVPAKTKNAWAVTGYGGNGRPRSAKLTALAYCR